MLDNLHNLDLTKKDIELIEAALHTQKKILSVQSQAGGSGARKKLTDIKHLMKRINRAGCLEKSQPMTLGQYARWFFSMEPRCSSTR
mmetsp:Transcript_39674/g.89950  ORF Transcript_39674/g.89950 Transcript_39674/m.89950 type:complete len:87 (+) Transcript_39674:26-286(+)